MYNLRVEKKLEKNIETYKIKKKKEKKISSEKVPEVERKENNNVLVGRSVRLS